MNDLLNILLLAFVGSVAGLVGGVLFLVNKKWASLLCKYAVPLAAGVLLSVSLLHLLPESVEVLGEEAFVWATGAFLASFLFEFFFAHLHHHDGHHHHERGGATAPLVIFGDTIHNFIDGVAIASAYLIAPTLGVVIAFSTFLHETPHEIADFGVLISKGWSKKRTFLANMFSAFATFPGALYVYFFAKGQSSVAPLLAISAGIFLYLGASDFLPELHKGKDKGDSLKKLAFLILGVGAMYALSTVSP